MKKSLIVFLMLLLLISILGTFAINTRYSPKSRISEGTLILVNSIKNEDVIWDLNFLGLMPELTGATLELEESREDINPLLVDVLTDEDKFVAAHVLLTFRAPGPYPFNGAEWNGLEVQVLSSGEVTFDGNDLRELQKLWKEKLHKQ